MKIPRILVGLLLAYWSGTLGHTQQNRFTPEIGLSGASTGEGSLRLLFGCPRFFQVRSHGQSERDGAFKLTQTVAFKGGAVTSRIWRIREVEPLEYAGTLSDAVGAVSGQTYGRRLVLKYRVKGPVMMRQTLDLMPDGKTIENSGRITVLGIPIGSMHEIIQRGD